MPVINQFVEQSMRLQNRMHTLLIMAAMLLLLGIIGWLFGGAPGALFALFLLLLSLIITPQISPVLLLKLYRAQALSSSSAPGLYEAVNRLSEKAGLENFPEIYYLPSPVINSFTLGRQDDAKIVVSDGLIRLLDSRELVSVLAHEVAHIQNNDISVMSLADAMSRITSIMSLSGLLLLLISLPLLALNQTELPILGLLLLTFAPNLAALLQLALSRTREFTADLHAVALTGDPLGLARALQKIEWQEQHWSKRLLIPHYRLSEPSLLRTHPKSEERIERLKALSNNYEQKHSALELISHKFPPLRHKARHRIHGIWH